MKRKKVKLKNKRIKNSLDKKIQTIKYGKVYYEKVLNHTEDSL